jgi:hypothetical protein
MAIKPGYEKTITYRFIVPGFAIIVAPIALFGVVFLPLYSFYLLGSVTADAVIERLDK